MAYLENMIPSDVKLAIDAGQPLVFGFGTIEYHGSQLPLGTDLLIVNRIIETIEKEAKIVVAPSVSLSPTGYMVSGPEFGTVDVRVGTFIEYCSQIIKGYKRMGFKNICLIVHHQSNNITEMLKMSLMQANSYSAYEESGEGWWSNNNQINDDCNIRIIPAIDKSENDAFGGHGGKGETQAILALAPQTVHMEQLSCSEFWWNMNASEANKKIADEEMVKNIAILKQKILM